MGPRRAWVHRGLPTAVRSRDNRAPRARGATALRGVGSLTVHLGIQFSPANASWNDLQDGARLVDALGYDSLWTADHLRSGGSPDAPYLESWQIVGAWAALTSRARLGVLVSAVTFRHPAVVAKMAATLDHVSGGRAILGLGAGWLEVEHTSFGIAFGTKRERGQKLMEAAAVARALFDESRSNFGGKHFQLVEAVAEPKPLQSRLPILIGGSGERTVLPAVARYADFWNAHGDPAYLAAKLSRLRERCARVGRDPGEITATTAIRPLIVRDSQGEIEARYSEVMTANRQAQRDDRYAVVGDVEAVARRLAEFLKAGITGFIVQMPMPFDHVTIERLIFEVRPRLLELVAA